MIFLPDNASDLAKSWSYLCVAVLFGSCLWATHCACEAPRDDWDLGHGQACVDLIAWPSLQHKH